jgi:hypothetical protein
MKSIIKPIINNTRLTCVLVFLSIDILPITKRIESGRKKALLFYDESLRESGRVRNFRLPGNKAPQPAWGETGYPE